MNGERDARTGVLVGWIGMAPLVIAAFGWGAGWNAYYNLTLTLGSAVLMLVGRIAANVADEDRIVVWLEGGASE